MYSISSFHSFIVVLEGYTSREGEKGTNHKKRLTPSSQHEIILTWKRENSMDFAVGDIVESKYFGAGEVVSIGTGDYPIRVKFAKVYHPFTKNGRFVKNNRNANFDITHKEQL